MADETDPNRPEGDAPPPTSPEGGPPPPAADQSLNSPPPSEPPLPEAETHARSEPEELAAMRAKLVALIRAGGAQAGHWGGRAWARLRRIRRPHTLREAAVWAGWGVGGFAAILALIFVFLTWDMPSTDDLWEPTNAPSITFVDRAGTVILRE
ncbi:MAG: hypothetical protein AB7L65_02105, partial [Hyphomonadaceae bacterium]